MTLHTLGPFMYEWSKATLNYAQQVEAEFSPRPYIKKIVPAKLLASAPSMVPV